MVQTLSKRLSKFKRGKDPDKLTDDDIKIRNFLQEVSIFAIDEVHHENANTYREAMKTAKKCLIRTGFSGTIESEKTLIGLQLRSLLGSVVYRVRNIDLIDKGISLIPKVFFYCLDLDKKYLADVKKRAKRDHYIKRLQSEDEKVRETPFAGMGGYQFQKIYEEGVIFNQEQNDIIINTVKLLISKKLQTLIIVDRKETHGKHLVELFEEAGLPFLLWTGDTKDRSTVLEKFQMKQVPVLIATSVIDEGVNVHSIDAIILASGLKSTTKLLQRAGRGLRTGSSNDFLLIFDFLHIGEDTLESHAKSRIALWKDEGFQLFYVDTITDLQYHLQNLKV
jgi:superfamily II DNA or RNA helicase